MHDLDALRQHIEKELAVLLPTESAIAQPMLDAMRHAVLGGGKRMRPMFACASCEAFGGDMHAALVSGCALEFIHSYSLIHDDLPAMDDDDIRHGQPSTHIAYGEANAILAGDSLHSLAFQAIVTSDLLPDQSKLRIIQLLSDAAGWAGMSGGQCLDIEAEGRELDLNELKALHAAKTGALIRASLQIGAFSATSSPDTYRYQAISDVGDYIGLAFQIMDDVLDVTQSTDVLGKPAGSDEQQEKNTFPKLLGLDASKAEAERLLSDAIARLNDGDLATPTLIQLVTRAVRRNY
jgi:geranylgeranyl pyrophosphate synthase